jgi:hypothetical protein
VPPVFATTNASLLTAIDREGFAFVQAAAMRELLAAHGSLADWAAFTESWARLELDYYRAAGGPSRGRRHAVYSVDVAADTITREAHQPHFQTVDYNPLNGGVARWFAPIEDATGSSAALHTIMAFCRATFDHLATSAHQGRGAPGDGGDGTFVPYDASAHRSKDWRVEVHQFRIEARTGQLGRPTPEGLHRDGVDYVLVLLVNRQNIASGVTTIHGLDGTTLGSFTLTTPLDAALVDDGRVAHGVTPVQEIRHGEPAYRDVLVVTFAARSRSK